LYNPTTTRPDQQEKEASDHERTEKVFNIRVEEEEREQRGKHS